MSSENNNFQMTKNFKQNSLEISNPAEAIDSIFDPYADPSKPYSVEDVFDYVKGAHEEEQRQLKQQQTSLSGLGTSVNNPMSNLNISNTYEKKFSNPERTMQQTTAMPQQQPMLITTRDPNMLAMNTPFVEPLISSASFSQPNLVKQSSMEIFKNSQQHPQQHSQQLQHPQQLQQQQQQYQQQFPQQQQNLATSLTHSLPQQQNISEQQQNPGIQIKQEQQTFLQQQNPIQFQQQQSSSSPKKSSNISNQQPLKDYNITTNVAQQQPSSSVHQKANIVDWPTYYPTPTEQLNFQQQSNIPTTSNYSNISQQQQQTQANIQNPYCSIYEEIPQSSNCILDYNQQQQHIPNISTEAPTNLNFSEYISSSASFPEPNRVVNLNDAVNFPRYSAQGSLINTTTTSQSQSLLVEESQQQQHQTILQRIKSVFKRPQIFPDVKDVAANSLIETPKQDIPTFWINITYYEMKERVGEPFKSNSPSVYIDGLCSPSDSSRMCLGSIGNVNRNALTVAARRQIGRGCRISKDADENIYLEGLDESPIFIQSALYSVMNNDSLITVYRVSIGVRLKIFDKRMFDKLVCDAASQGYNSLYSLQHMCHVRMSFVKGWGERYRRRTITSTPCWVEVQFTSALQLVDKILDSNRDPNEIMHSYS